MRAIILSLATFLLLSSTTAQAQDGKNAPKKEAAPKVRVKLLEAGSEPRQALRYHPPAGSEETMRMSMKMGITMNIGGNELPPRNAPTMEMVMRLTITESDENQFAYEFELTEIEVLEDEAVPEQVRQSMDERMQVLVGLKGEGRVDNRGFNQGASLTLPEDAPADAKEMFAGFEKSVNELSTPLPEEAVGVGAKWQVTQEVEANGMRITQTIEHELKELEGDEFSTTVTTRRWIPKVCGRMYPSISTVSVALATDNRPSI